MRTEAVDVIVTYKIDRMSRSLKDFYDLWEVLKSHNVTFVAATQHFDTSDSMGMLMLNILLSLAQFERELEGPIVRFMLQRVIETRSPCAVANEANARGYRTKAHTIKRRDGTQQERGGKRFDEDQVTAIVRNPIYKGFIHYGGVLYPAKHEAIVDEETWAEANRAIGNGHAEINSLKFKDDHVHPSKGHPPLWFLRHGDDTLPLRQENEGRHSVPLLRLCELHQGRKRVRLPDTTAACARL